MIVMSSSTFLALLGILVTVLGAVLALIWRAGVQQGQFNVTLQDLSKAVKNFSSLAERVLVLEVKLSEAEKHPDR